MNQKILNILLLFVVAFLMFYIVSMNMNAEVPVENEKIEEIVIPECDYGTIRVESKNGIEYSYIGKIHIVKDGKDGEEIEIVANYEDNMEE